MRRTVFVVPVMLIAGIAAAQEGSRPDPLNPAAKAPPIEYRSAMDGYRPFADQELSNWRKSNDDVGAAGGHLAHRPGQGSGQPTSKPQPGKPESAGGAAEKGGKAPGQPGHGGHK